MTAQAMTVEVAALAYSQAQRYEHQHSRMERARPVLTWLVSFPVNVAHGWLVSSVDGVARRLSEQAVFFRGARDWLANSTDGVAIDQDFELVAALDQMEAHLSELRRSTLELVTKLEKVKSHKVGVLRHSLRRVSAAAAELFEEVRAFRGQVMAYEADRGVLVSNDCGGDNHQALDDALRRLSDTA